MYNLNIVKSNVVQTNVIIGRIMDKPIDTLDFRIYNGHEPMDLTGCTLEFKGSTPDGNKVTSKSVQIKNSKQGDISFTVPENMYSARGRFKNAYFTVTKGSRVDSTNDIIIDVLNAVNYTQEEANEIKDMLDEILKESQAKVDKYVNDAIKDSQSKLDKYLKDSEAKVTAEMQKLQNSVANINANMSALEKDVASFKVTMDKELARMQKQLDDLAKAINQTDIQRPQITSTDGSQILEVSDWNKTTKELLESIENAKMSYITVGNAKDVPSAFIMGIMMPNKSRTHRTFIGTTLDGVVYHYSTNSNKWSRLDGQVSKVTKDDGSFRNVVTDTTKTAYEILASYGSGTFSINFYNSKEQPEMNIAGIVTQNLNSNTGKLEGQFVGSGLSTGNAYSYAYATSGVKGWKRLDGQAQKVTQDDGGSFVDKLTPISDYFKSINKGVTSRVIYWTNNTDFEKAGLPSELGHAFMIVNKVSDVSGFIQLSGSFGNSYVGIMNQNTWGGWKKINN